MFWIQIFIPLSLATAGVILLYADDLNSRRNRNVIDNSISSSKRRIIEVVERQDDSTQIRERLRDLGETDRSAYGEFRYRQIVAAGIAGLIPFFALFLMIINFIQAIGLSIFFGFGAFYMYDRHLSDLVKKRQLLVESEFPAIIEMLTLAIAAGDTPLNAFARISERSNSKLAAELADVVSAVRAGRPFHEALDEMGRQMKSSAIRRFVDALVMAMLRGAPIVEVLHRHVAEARINQRNLVMDKAGKAEMTMMIPIVFLILPISVLFALWPSINQLSFFAG